MPPRQSRVPAARAANASQSPSLLPFASLLASADNGPNFTSSQLEDTLALLTEHVDAAKLSSIDQEPLVVDLVALFGLALRSSVPAPAPPPRSGPGPSTCSGSSSAGASGSSTSMPYVTDEARQLYRRIRVRLSELLVQDILIIGDRNSRLRTLLLDLLLRTHMLRCYSSLLSTYAQLLRSRPSRRNLEGAQEVVQEVQLLLGAFKLIDLGLWEPEGTDAQRSVAPTDKPHPNIPHQMKHNFGRHLDQQLAESQLAEAWAVCFLQQAACQKVSLAHERTMESFLGSLEKVRWTGVTRGVIDEAPALQALLSLATVRNLASLDRGSSYGQAAAAAAAAGSEDGECGPPWTLIDPAARQTANVSALLEGGGDVALKAWQRILDRRLAADAAAPASSSVIGPAVAADVAEDWARGAGSLPRPGLEQLQAQEAEVKRLQAARREVYRSLQAADEAQQQQKQQQKQVGGLGAGMSGQRQQQGAGARPAQGQAKGRGGAAGKSRHGQAQGQEQGQPRGGAGASSSSQAPALTPERRAELEVQAAALTAQLRQARHLPAVVPLSERDTFKPIQKGYISVQLESAQHALHTGDPALQHGPPGYRIRFTTNYMVMEAFVEESPGVGSYCFMRPYVAARAVAAELRSRGVVLPAGLEELLEEAPEAINDDDVSWMNKILRRAGKESMLPQPLPAQLALPPWNDAATFDVCIRLANAARTEWVKWAAQQSPSLMTRDKYPYDAARKAMAACKAVDCALTAARLLARSGPPSAQARRAVIRRLRQLWQCYCAALEAALGLVQRGRGAEGATAAAQGERLLPEGLFGTVWGWQQALSHSPDVFRLLPEEGRGLAGQVASGAGGADTKSGAGGAVDRPGPEAAALLSAGYLRLWTLCEYASLLTKGKPATRYVGRVQCWAEVLAFGPPGDLLDLLAVAALRAREAPAAGRRYLSKLRGAAAASELPNYNQEITAVTLPTDHERALFCTHAAARLLWTLHAAAPLFAAGCSAGGAGGEGSRGRDHQAAQAGVAQQPLRPHLEQLGLMWSVVAEQMLPGVAEGLICTSTYHDGGSWCRRRGRAHHTAATALLCCRLLLNALHLSGKAGAAAADAEGEGGSSKGNGAGGSGSDDGALWRRLLLCDVDVFSLLAATAAIIRHDLQPVEDEEEEPGPTYGGGGGEDEAGIDVRWACAELHSTAVLVAAVLPQECAMAAQQGANGSAGPDGAEQPGRYRMPLAVESIAGLFGPDGPCPNPQWQADVREAFASAGAVAANGPQQELSPEQLQACASRAHAALQQQRDPQQMQAAAALLVPPGRVRSALRRRYAGRRLWLCDNPACVPAAELDASGWPLLPQSCAGAGAWVWCGGCESSLYCSDGCRLAHWQAGHGAVCRLYRGAVGQGT